MIWSQILLLLVADISTAPGARCSLEKPALSWIGPKGADTLGFEPLSLLALGDGWLGLAAGNGGVQFRSPTGEWSNVRQLPVDVVLKVESAGSGLLVAGAVLLAEGWKVFLVGVDGRIKETWNLPDNPFYVQSLATWRDTYWATVSEGWWTRPSPNGLLELLPGGKVVRHADIPKTEEDGHLVVPWDAVLYFGPTGEKVYCVPHECQHDGPCHYGYCYRKDKVAWREWGHWWWLPVPCGDYLLEQEVAVREPHFSFSRNRTVVRRIRDGVQVASVRTGADTGITCAGPDEFLLNAGKSITSFSLPTGRRRWSVQVAKRAGSVVTLARAGTCTIALTHRNFMVSICPGADERMVTTVTR